MPQARPSNSFDGSAPAKTGSSFSGTTRSRPGSGRRPWLARLVIQQAHIGQPLGGHQVADGGFARAVAHQQQARCPDRRAAGGRRRSASPGPGPRRRSRRRWRRSGRPGPARRAGAAASAGAGRNCSTLAPLGMSTTRPGRMPRSAQPGLDAARDHHDVPAPAGSRTSTTSAQRMARGLEARPAPPRFRATGRAPRTPAACAAAR